MTKSKIAAARKMAEQHVAIDPSVMEVYLLQALPAESATEPIKLLEIVEGTPERGIEPVYFPADPSRGYRVPVVIVDVSPREYDGLKRRKSIRFRSEKWEISQRLAARA